MRQLRQYRTLAALVAVVALALPGALWAQAQGGNLEGRIVDSSGAALPGATVTASNTATGLARVETSDADGRFRFVSLPIGTYRVTAELSGFGEVVVENVQLNVATDRRIEVDSQSGGGRRNHHRHQRAAAAGERAGDRRRGEPERAGEPAAQRPPVRQPRGAGAGHQPGGQRRPDQARAAHRGAGRRHRPQRQLRRWTAATTPTTRSAARCRTSIWRRSRSSRSRPSSTRPSTAARAAAC